MFFLTVMEIKQFKKYMKCLFIRQTANFIRKIHGCIFSCFTEQESSALIGHVVLKRATLLDNSLTPCCHCKIHLHCHVHPSALSFQTNLTAKL